MLGITKAATDVPDPLLLASSLESIWLYIESSFTRKEVIGKVHWPLGWRAPARGAP